MLTRPVAQQSNHAERNTCSGVDPASQPARITTELLAQGSGGNPYLGKSGEVQRTAPHPPAQHPLTPPDPPTLQMRAREGESSSSAFKTHAVTFNLELKTKLGAA